MKLANMTGQEMLQAIDAMKKSLDNLDLLANISLQIAVDHNVRRKLDMLTAVKQLYRWKQGGEKPELNAASVFNPHDGLDKTNIYYIFKELRKGMPWEIRRDYLVLPFAITLTLFDTLNSLFPCPEVSRGMMLNQRFINKITLPKYRADISELEAQEKRERYMRELDDLERDFEKLYEDLALFFTRQIDPEKDEVVKDIHDAKVAAKKAANILGANEVPASFATQERALKIWDEFRNNIEVKNKYTTKGHRIAYKDVFDYCKKMLLEAGIKSARDFEKVVKAAKKRVK